jgi:hypothetical protein
MMAITESDHRPAAFYAAGAPNADSARYAVATDQPSDARRISSSDLPSGCVPDVPAQRRPVQAADRRPGVGELRGPAQI